MGDKLANVLIVFMMIVIFGLGGMYYAKVVTGGKEVPESNSAIYNNELTYNVDQIGVNISNTVQKVVTEDNRTNLDISLDNTTNLYTKNPAGVGKGYYYSQLNEYSKVMYDAIANNTDKLKNGNSKIAINYDFSKVWNNGNGKDEIDACYADAVNALNIDRSDLFYIDLSRMSLIIKTTSTLFSTKYELYIDVDERYPNYYADGFSNRSQVESAISAVENAKNKVKQTLTGTDYDKIKTLHDWIVDYMYYDSSSAHKASVYGAFAEKKGVCEAYARVFKYILDDTGIENILVTGKATNSSGVTEDHMWNYVKLNGTWYAVDATWDDPVVIGGGTVSDQLKHRYFLVGSRELFKNHTERLTISASSKIFALPKLSTNNY